MSRDTRIGNAVQFGDPGELEPSDVRWLVDRWATLNTIRACVDACRSSRDWDRAHAEIVRALETLDRIDAERVE